MATQLAVALADQAEGKGRNGRKRVWRHARQKHGAAVVAEAQAFAARRAAEEQRAAQQAQLEAERPRWAVGDKYWQAEAWMGDESCDIEAEPRRTEGEAKGDADIWWSDLSERERARATTYVRQFVVLELDDGHIGASKSAD